MSFHYFPEIPHVDTIAQTTPVTNYNKERTRARWARILTIGDGSVEKVKTEPLNFFET